MRRVLFIIASILVSVVILALAVGDVPLDGVGERISSADPVWLFILALIIVGGLAARGMRWQALLGSKLTFAQAFHSSNIMFMLNFLPLRLGEVARAAIATRYGVSFVSAATGVLVERLIDTVLVVVILSFSLARVPQAPEIATTSATIFGVGALAAFVVLLMLARFPTAAERLLDIVERILPFLKRLPLRRILHDILVGLEPLTHLRGAVAILGWTIIAWVFSFSGYYALQRAFDLPPIDLWLNSLLSICLIALSIAIPTTIAQVGPFQAAARIGGEAMGLTAADALSLGITYHVMTFIVYSTLGIIGLIVLGVSLGDVTGRKAAKPESPAVDVAC
jgi:uncharacterized membrane protein YbhN (UPF0104 family)